MVLEYAHNDIVLAKEYEMFLNESADAEER